MSLRPLSLRNYMEEGVQEKREQREGKCELSTPQTPTPPSVEFASSLLEPELEAFSCCSPRPHPGATEDQKGKIQCHFSGATNSGLLSRSAWDSLFFRVLKCHLHAFFPGFLALRG